MTGHSLLAEILMKHVIREGDPVASGDVDEAILQTSLAINNLVLEAVTRNLEACIGCDDLETAANVKNRLAELHTSVA